MPQDADLAQRMWYRYIWCRDNGHMQYLLKHDKCERFFAGDQWEETDLALLREQRRPAMTINKIISTLSTVFGEQIHNRNEIGFRARNGSARDTAETLTKVFKQISDNNQLDWKRSDMFADGCIGSRGFLDVRLGFNDSTQGEVVIDKINPKNVIIDPDAEDYDPDTWGEVFVTKWMTCDDIAILYNKDDADQLRGREQSFFPYGYDSIEAFRDRFGVRLNPIYGGSYQDTNVLRNIRVIDRQYRKMDNQKHFIDPATGDMRPIPDSWSRDKIAAIREQHRLEVVKKLVRRIRWTVIADSFVLHDDWSPYKHFTIVPYFPYFRHGRTIGLVENLLGPQEILNKVSSQELHVVNTSANSGWKVKAGALINMTVEELEQRGAQTGLVMELSEIDGAEKITPNPTPQGLDRLTYKAEEHIKSISNISDSMQGFDREDVAAKAIQTKRQAGTLNLAKPLDGLIRTDFILARNILDLVQEFYTEPRILTITKDRMTGETEEVPINQVTPEGEIVNDLMIGEYDVIVSSTPVRESLEDTQFDQAVALKQLGVGIPDSVLIESSKLMRKQEILKQMEGDKDSPEAQAQALLQKRAQEAEVAKAEGEAASKSADAKLKLAKADKETVAAQKEAATPPEAGDSAAAQLEKVERDYEIGLQKLQLEREKAKAEIEMQREKTAAELQIKSQNEAEKRRTERVQAVIAARQQAQQPQQSQQPPQGEAK